MFIMPILFLCNAFLFAVLLEERFKVITTLTISAAAYILSLVANFAAEGMLSDPAISGHVGNALCALILLITSVFISSNNLSQKIFVALLVISNYAFITDFVPHLLGAVSFESAGILAVLFANGLYILFTLITFAFFSRPLHYFFRRSSSPSMIGLCVLQFLCWFFAKGAANDFFGTDSFPLRFFFTLASYILVVFCFRSIYGGARYKARDVIQATDQAIMNIEADSFSTMLVNVNTYKMIKKNLDYQLDRIGAMADAGKTRELSEYVALSKQKSPLNPLLTEYNENPYINAILATKTALATSKGVRLESSVSLGDMEVKLVEVCVIINDLLDLAIVKAENAKEDKYIRLNVVPADRQLAVETVYTEDDTHEPSAPFTARTIFSFLESFFEKKDDESDDALRNIMDIIEKRSGKINISHSDHTVITRIGINY
ncbi:MAG: hypothetical protein RSC76_08210 [Oscillospiraceae bacterium]